MEKEIQITKEQKSLKYLKDFGKNPTYKIASACSMNNDTAKKVFEQLHKERKIKKIEETVSTYWEITKIGEKTLQGENL